MPSLVDAGNTRWVRFLSRWSLLAGLVSLALFSGFFATILPSAGKGPLPAESGLGAADFAAALNQPVLYRIVIMFDLAGWLTLAGFFIAFAALFAERAPIRSTFIAACGVSMISGMIGAYIRLAGTTELAARYLAAPPAQQAPILQRYLGLVDVIGGHFGIGALLWGTALVLIASVAWSSHEFPRWLTLGLAIPGLMEVVQQIVGLLTGTDLGFLFVPALILLMLVYFALAWRLWSGAPTGRAQLLAE